MSLGKVILFAMFSAFAFGIAIGFFARAVPNQARVLTVKAPRVRSAFDALTATTGNKNQDTLIAIVDELNQHIQNLQLQIEKQAIQYSDERDKMLNSISWCATRGLRLVHRSLNVITKQFS
jgi:hypothetical protein